MPQNISLAGAVYSDVPAVSLPKQGGGTATFTDVTDTTASASDVASGKYFYTSAGVKTQGTSSGGGGSTKLVQGTFTTSSTTNKAEDITLSYSGSGYPIACMVYIDGGAYNNTSTGNTTWYNSVQRYAVGQWTYSKSNTTTTPTYSSSGSENYGVTTAIYKNSTSNSTSYTRTSAMNTVVCSGGNATNSANNVVKFKSATKLSVFVASSSYGLLASTKYAYIVVYSS